MPQLFYVLLGCQTSLAIEAFWEPWKKALQSVYSLPLVNLLHPQAQRSPLVLNSILSLKYDSATGGRDYSLSHFLHFKRKIRLKIRSNPLTLDFISAIGQIN